MTRYRLCTGQEVNDQELYWEFIKSIDMVDEFNLWSDAVIEEKNPEVKDNEVV